MRALEYAHAMIPSPSTRTTAEPWARPSCEPSELAIALPTAPKAQQTLHVWVSEKGRRREGGRDHTQQGSAELSPNH